VRPLVLMYHGVGVRPDEVDPDHLFVPAAALRAQLTLLLDRGWRPLTLEQYLSGAAGRREFLLTFDDGYAGLLDEAVPLLAELRVPSVCFMLPGRWGGTGAWNTANPDEPLVDRGDLAAMERAGMAVELHGWDHTSLPGLPPAELEHQVAGAADAFADVLHRRPRVFAYPFGHHDAAARAAVRRAGIGHAFAVYDGLPAGHPDAALAVPRVDVNASDTLRTFRLKTLRAYPAARRLLGRAPAVRRGLHAVVGRAALV
jgi:peptidoglycan/xylan/chitin deacetylase (PgdA/CDA1 family)